MDNYYEVSEKPFDKPPKRLKTELAAMNFARECILSGSNGQYVYAIEFDKSGNKTTVFLEYLPPLADVCTKNSTTDAFTVAKQLSDAAFNLDNLPRDNFTQGQIQDMRDCVDMLYSVAADLAGNRASELLPDENEQAAQIEEALSRDCGCIYPESQS